MQIYYHDHGFWASGIHEIPEGAVEITAEYHAELLAAQCKGCRIEPDAEGRPVAVPPPEPTPEERLAAVQAHFTGAIQAHLDTFAALRGYDGILSAATYATSTVPRFRAEGQCAVEARDATWAAAYTLMDAVLAGKREMPSLGDVLAELPKLAWPEA